MMSYDNQMPLIAKSFNTVLTQTSHEILKVFPNIPRSYQINAALINYYKDGKHWLKRHLDNGTGHEET